MSFCLLELSMHELQDVAASRVPPSLAPRLDDGALPPPFVAARSLDLRACGHPVPWSTTFLIVRQGDGRIVGACGFKTAPCNGEVELGYGVAPGARGQGAATAAVKMLLTRAFEAGASQVLAAVAPENHASTHVVEKAGFRRDGAGFDQDREYVIRWIKVSAA